MQTIPWTRLWPSAFLLHLQQAGSVAGGQLRVKGASLVSGTLGGPRDIDVSHLTMMWLPRQYECAVVEVQKILESCQGQLSGLKAVGHPALVRSQGTLWPMTAEPFIGLTT